MLMSVFFCNTCKAVDHTVALWLHRAHGGGAHPSIEEEREELFKSDD
jgi:hypothetical protein